MYFQGCTTPALTQSRVLATHRLAVVMIVNITLAVIRIF